MNPGKTGRYDALAEDIKRNPPKVTGELLRRVFSYLLPYRLQMLLATGAIILAAIFDLLPSILTGKIIDDGFIAGNLSLLLILIGVSFAVHLLSNLIGILQNYWNTWVAQSISRNMRNQMYAHLQKMSQRFFTSSKQGDIITRMTSDIAGVQSVISGTLASTISNVAILLTSVIAMYQKNWILATVGMVIVPLFVLPTKSVGKRRWSLTLQSQQKNDEINQILNETLSVSGQQLVKLYTNEERELRRYEAANEGMFRLNIKESLAGRWFRMVISTFTNIGPMLIYLVSGILILKMGNTDLSVGDITVMVALLTRMYKPVNNLLGIQVDFIRAMALFTRIFSYQDMSVEIENKEDPVKPEIIQGNIHFEQVDFHYTPEAPVLRNLSFEVEAGKSVAIVGPSGAGKSTMISLLSRLYDVTGGSIRLDGTDLRDWDLNALRGGIGIVTQESYLFNGTIRENLLYAKAGATEREMMKACREANIHDFIMSLKNGYDTVVGNRGIKLSGGERQRISIARVILKNPRVLILDEATSSLDSISENLVQTAIGPLIKNRTSIVIAHRLSTIIAADEIIVIDGGEIVERGPHHRLLQNHGVYATLYDTQFSRVFEEYKCS